jgi:hypothetical protein
MSYNYQTQYNSPNYTPAASVPSAYGIGARKIDGITIHWWGDPNANPSFNGIVNYLCRKDGNTSAHYVATGTGRQVACIVAPKDVAWHGGSGWANVHTIGIEMDPRGRPEDFDVAAELIADIRSAYGDVPLYWHSYFKATACPGVYRDRIDYLDKLSYTKFSATQWGKGGDKIAAPVPPVVVAPAPTPAPTPAPVTLVKQTNFDVPKVFKVKSATQLFNIPEGSRYGSTSYAVDHLVTDVVELQEYSNGRKFYRTKYARDTAKKNYGFDFDTVVEVVPEVPAPEVVIPSPTTQDPTTGQPLPDTGKDIVDKNDYQEFIDALNKNNSLIQWIIDVIKKIFNIK